MTCRHCLHNFYALVRLTNLIDVVFAKLFVNTVSMFDDYLLTLKPNKKT